MKNTINRFASFLVLLLFLFPLVETELHAISHWNDKHCLETGLHFHQEEHHCTLCDFVLPLGNSQLISDIGFKKYLSDSTFLPSLIPAAVLHAPEYYFSLRAPPAVV
jgi:hypothetical protein